MQRVPSVKTIRGPIHVSFMDSSQWTYERTVTHINRWRTIRIEGVGEMKMNMGKVLWSPARLVRIS